MRVVPVLVLAVVATLSPSCATYSLWGRTFPSGERDRDGAPAPELVPVGQQTHREQLRVGDPGDAGPGALHTVAAAAAAAGSGVDPVADASRWRLRPANGAEVARLLLTTPGLVDGVELVVSARREFHDDDLVRNDTLLTLTADTRPDALGDVVERAALGDAALAVLAEPRRNAFVYAADPWLYLPAVLRPCGQWLETPAVASTLDGLLTGPPGDAHGTARGGARWTSFVFVGDDGRPRFEPGMDVPADANDRDLPGARRVELLRAVELVLRLEHDGRERFVRLRPDRLWMWSTCEIAGERLRHESSWHLEPGRGAPLPPGASTWPLAIECTDVRFQRVFGGAAAPVTWDRVLLTPLAVVADVTVLLPFNLLVGWLEDDEDELPPPRAR